MSASARFYSRVATSLAWRARAAARLVAAVPRWLSFVRSGSAADSGVAVSYGRRLPPLDAPGRGGTVKFQRLARELPDAGADFNVLYLGSSDRPPDLRVLVRLARRRGAAFVWNQNGVAYPGWAGRRTRDINRPLAYALHAADHVFYQSEFCRLSADSFLGERGGPAEILHNPVDTSDFTPERRPDRPLTLLLGGDQFQRYRVESALATLAELSAELPEARLLVTGSLLFARSEAASRREFDERVRALGLSGRVEPLGRYAPSDAVSVFRRADVLLHTKFNDPCPSTVLEAMSCGLPVVYSASGGVPELVGEDGGIGVPAPLDFERDHAPDPAALAAGVLSVAARLDEFAAAARRRAVERFDFRRWVERHREVFERLIR